MSGNAKQSASLKQRYGDNYFVELGRKGRAKSVSRPFRDDPTLASRAAKIRWAKYYADRRTTQGDQT